MTRLHGLILLGAVLFPVFCYLVCFRKSQSKSKSEPINPADKPVENATAQLVGLSSVTPVTLDEFKEAIKMTVGIEVSTPDNIVQITDQMFSLEYKEKRQITFMGGMFGLYGTMLAPVGGYENEVVAIRRLTNTMNAALNKAIGSTWYRRVWMQNGTTNIVQAGTPNSTEYHCFNISDWPGIFEVYYFGNPSTDIKTGGLQIYNSAGKPTFSYDKKYMKVLGALNTPAATVGTRPADVFAQAPNSSFALLQPCSYRNWGVKNTNGSTSVSMDVMYFDQSLNRVGVTQYPVGMLAAGVTYNQVTSSGFVLMIDVSQF